MAKKPIGKMFFKDIDDDVWEYELHIDPPEALHWKNYKVKLSDIKVISDANKEIKKRVRKEILKDMNEYE
tara:strand:+ start:291 stop:500 length:210 start_codon:yes stop_codon:yes gene_type:complete